MRVQRRLGEEDDVLGAPGFDCLHTAMKTMTVRVLDKVAAAEEEGGHGYAVAVLRRGFGRRENGEEERGRRSRERGKRWGGSGLAAWHAGGRRGGSRGPRWRPRRSARHRAASGAGEEDDTGGRYAGPARGVGPRLRRKVRSFPSLFSLFLFLFLFHLFCLDLK